MPGNIAVRRLVGTDLEDYRTIRLAALETAPRAFGSVHAIEAAKPAKWHAERLAASTVYGAYASKRIVGMIGFARGKGPKDEHKGIVWGFYVEPDHRNGGAGSALMAALVEGSRGIVEQLMLSVVEDNAGAIGLYEKFGFKSYGVEPRALKDEAGYSNELLMVLILQGGGSQGISTAKVAERDE